MTLARGVTGLLVIDPYNDFISEGGKVWDRLKDVAEANGCIPHMNQVLDAARQVDIRVFYALHRRHRPGDYEIWKYVAPIQKAAWERKTFEFGTWGGELRDEFLPQARDIVAQEHWCSSGFANTDAATSSYSDDHMHAALEVNLPNYAAVVTADEAVDAIRAGQ